MQYHNKSTIYSDANQLVNGRKMLKTLSRYYKYRLGSEIIKTSYDLIISIAYSINNTNTRKQSVKKARNNQRQLRQLFNQTI